jgi:peptidylprolyl isomerase
VPNPDGEVITTASGLQYILIDPGTGAQPQPGDTVSVHYTGMLDDGTVFDSSRTRGQPIQFVLGRGQVIAGWDEGIALLKEGGSARLIVPPDLAYGSAGYPGAIPPNATLTFDVELVSVQK